MSCGIVAVFQLQRQAEGFRTVCREVVTQTVSRNSFDNSNSYVGTVDAGASSVLSFETGGKITRLLCREGDRVAKGQLLGTVSPTTLRDSHYATQVTLQQAQDAYKRMKNSTTEA